MTRTVLAAVLLSGLTLVDPRSAGAQTEPPGVQLYQLDARLARRGCEPRSERSDVPTIDLDGSGRYVDLIATKTQPAYWSDTLSEIRIRNTPDPNGSGAQGTTSGENTLVLEVGDKLTPGGFTKTLTPADPVPLKRDDMKPFQAAGVVQVRVLRQERLISTLWLVLRDPTVIVFNEDGALDQAYRSTVVPACVQSTFEVEYLPTNPATAPPLALAGGRGATPVFATKPLAVRAPGAPSRVFERMNWADLPKTKRDGRDDAELVSLKNGRAIGVLWLTQKAPSGFTPVIRAPRPGAATRQTSTTSQTSSTATRAASAKVEVLLDRLGVASPAFLNRRRPAYIPASAGNVDLVFRSIAPDRTFIITFSGIPESERPELVRSGMQINGCRDAKCKAAFRVSPGGSIALPVTALRNAYARSEVGSTVTMEVAFYDDDNTPTNNRGYLTFVDQAYFVEPSSTTAWTGSLSVSLLDDPDLSGRVPEGKKSPEITSADPWDRINRWHVTGSATLGLKQALGNRADFEAELTAKQGDFGTDSGSVGSSKYLANVYASYGATITGGRFDIAAPTEAVAFSASGEAVNIGGRLGRVPAYASVGYIFKKELPEGSFTAGALKKAVEGGASSLDRNNREVVLQVKDIAIGRLRSAAYGVIGDADRGRLRSVDSTSTLEEFDADQWTAGGHAIVSLGRSLASLGLYHSERSSDAPADLKLASDDRSGNVGLLSFSYTNVDWDKFDGSQQATDFSVTGQVGRGGAYVGESQAFAPDQVFLSKFAGALSDPDAPIGTGLTNKWYYGLVATTPKLDWLSMGKGVATLKIHHYRLAEERAESRNLGTEASLEVRVEQPKGVRYQMTFAGFQPGGALKPSEASFALMRKFQYVFKFNVTVRME